MCVHSRDDLGLTRSKNQAIFMLALAVWHSKRPDRFGDC